METVEKLSDRVIMQIMEMITIQKRFQPGDKLPNENELSSEMGVSRTTLREAVNNLVAQNVLERKRGRGTFVVNDQNLIGDLGFDDLNFIHVRLLDLYELRLVIEPQIAGIAALKATGEDMKRIIKYGNLSMKDNLPPEKIMEYNRRFHNEIAKATHNEFIIRLFDSINRAVIKELDAAKKQDFLGGDMIKSHKMLLDYLVLRDAQGASQAMRLHLKYMIRDFGMDISDL